MGSLGCSLYAEITYGNNLFLLYLYLTGCLHTFFWVHNTIYTDYVKKEGYALYAHDMYGAAFLEEMVNPGSPDTNVNDTARCVCNLVASLRRGR
jgi:hypothetical protein